MRDPYEFLAVPRSATTDDIKRSFRKLAKKLHPDANSNDPNVALFTELKAAYAILSDRKKRNAFDRGEIDGQGRPTRQAVWHARRRHRLMSGLWRIVTCLIIAVLMPVATLPLIRSLAPHAQISPNSDEQDRVLSGLGSNERIAPIRQPDRSVQPELLVILQPVVPRAAGDSIPVGAQVIGGAVGSVLEISGLPTGMTISPGRPVGAGLWRILARDVDDAVIRPPPGFSGSIDVAIELRLIDDTVVDRGSLHLEWLKKPTTAPPPIEPAVATADSISSAERATATSARTNQNVIQQASDSPGDPIELLIARSEKLLADGDGEAARLLLQPAAEAHDGRAALALGATYDPIMLAILRAHAITADVSVALNWYKKASEFGSRKAQQRLDLLTAASTTIKSLRDLAISDHAPPKAMPTPVEEPTRRVVLRELTHPHRTRHNRYGVDVAEGSIGAHPDPLTLPPPFIQ